MEKQRIMENQPGLNSALIRPAEVGPQRYVTLKRVSELLLFNRYYPGLADEEHHCAEVLQ